MSDNQTKILVKNFIDLTKVTSEQSLLLRNMADQIRALFVINAALISASKDGIDIERVRRMALGALPNVSEDANATAYVNAVLGPNSSNDSSSSDEAIQDKIQNVIGISLRVIEGGKQIAIRTSENKK